MTTVPLTLTDVEKSFTLHLRGGARRTVVREVNFRLAWGACVALGGPSGIGKSTILRMIYGNYSVDGGSIAITHAGGTVDMAHLEPRAVLAVRRETISYVSQFLRVVPRVSTLDVVAEPLLQRGRSRDDARGVAAGLLQRLNLAEELWDLPPATFSGGEQQRVNIARGFITDHPILLLDEPTASLDADNRAVVIDMIEEKKRGGAALLGIFHDPDVRERVADSTVDVTRFSASRTAA